MQGGDDVALLAWEEDVALHVVAVPCSVRVLYDNVAFFKRLDALVHHGDDELARIAENAPFFALARRDIARCIGGELIVLRRNDEFSCGVDCAPFFALLYERERCGARGWLCLLLVQQDLYAAVERVADRFLCRLAYGACDRKPAAVNAAMERSSLCFVRNMMRLISFAMNTPMCTAYRIFLCNTIFIQQFPRWTCRRWRRAIAVRRSMSAIGVGGALMRWRGK